MAEISGRETRDLAAEKAGFGGRETYRQAAKVVDKGVPELVSAVEVSVSTAAEVATLPPAEQSEIVAKGDMAILAVLGAVAALFANICSGGL